MSKSIFKPVFKPILTVACLAFSSVSAFSTPVLPFSNGEKSGCPCDEIGSDYLKKISREFDQDATGTTALYNKYGKVDVKTWPQNRVKIDVTITIKANSQAEADKYLKNYDVNFTNTGSYVKAETIIQDQNSNSFSWGNSLFGWSSECKEFRIDYDVFLPATNQLDLKNKYGDSFLAALEGKLTAEIKYGDLRSEGLKNDASLNIGYGKAALRNAVNVSGKVSYGELSVGECRDIALESAYSELKFDRANDLNLTSKYDEMVIGQVHDLRVETKYSDLKTRSAHNVSANAQYTDMTFGWLGSSGDFDMNYGDLKIETLAKDFRDLILDGSYTDFSIGVEKGGGFKLDASSAYGDLRYPQNLNVKSFEESGNRKTVSASHGDGKGTIRAKLNYGDFILR